MDAVGAAAIWYAERGWLVVPLHGIDESGHCTCGNPTCSSPAKHPRTEHGVKDASSDPETVSGWWRRWTAANVGIATGERSGIFVLDVDSREAFEGLKEKIPVGALMQQTGRGWQVLFKHPGFKVKNSSGEIAPDIDVRGDGGYIVAPPSIHANGKCYTWKAEGEPGQAPEWLLDFLRNGKHAEHQQAPEPAPTIRTADERTRAYVAAALHDEHATVRAAQRGARNATLNAAAFALGTLVHLGADEDDCERALVSAAIVAGLPEDEARRTFRSGWSAGAQQPREIAEREYQRPSRPTAPIQPAPSTFVDWSTFWDRDWSLAEWAFEDVLARGRGHALYASHKSGKSLLALFMAAKLATGDERIVCIYLDYEMSQEDLFDRLEDMGYGPGADLSRLKYALLPTLPPLDTPAGAAALMQMVDGVQTEWPEHHLVVIVDTISRAVAGEENSADTFRDFYANTGIELKRRSLTWARLDHGGKDPTKGQRGSSGKGDDVDVVWRLEKTQNGVCLHRDLARMPWVPEKVTFGMTEDPLSFRRLAEDWPAGTREVADELDRLQVPPTMSIKAAQQALRDSQEPKRRLVVAAAQRWRRERGEKAR